MVTANFGDIDMSKIAGMSGKGEYFEKITINEKTQSEEVKNPIPEDRLYYKWKTKSQTGEISDPCVLE